MYSIDEESIISIDRMQLAICLIMILEHERLELKEIIDATGMQFEQVRKAMHNLSMLSLIRVEPVFRSVPYFSIIDKKEAKKFLNSLGF